MEFIGTFGRFCLFPWIALEIGMQAVISSADLEISPISTDLFLSNKGGN